MVKRLIKPIKTTRPMVVLSGEMINLVKNEMHSKC